MAAPGSVPEHGPLLAIDGVVKRFGAQTALGGVSLSIGAGEIVALAGENGAGKSTLMAICSGALAPDSGTLRWEGHAVRFRGSADASAAGIAIVHQEPQIVGTLSVAENLVLGQLPRRAAGIVNWREAERTAREALSRLGLSLPLQQQLGSLGPGVRQLVAIARAVHRGARLLILDEPTSSLALDDAQRLAEIVREVAAQGTAVIYISHRIEELRPLAHRLVVLRDGLVTLDSPLASVTSASLWSALCGGAEKPAGGAHSVVTVTPESAPLLDVRGLTRRDRLRDVSVHVHRGELVGVAGLVGSGRSRLLHTIFGAAKADAGTVRVHDGRSSREVRTIAGAVAAGIGMVPEDRRRQGLIVAATIATNVCLSLPPEAVSRGWLRRRRIVEAAATAIERLRIRAQGPSQPVDQLSGGNQQKVLLARWIRAGTRVLLLDEPTRGVDVVAKAEIHQILRDAATHGLGLLVASSDLPELLSLCDRIYVIRAGAVADEVRGAETDATRLLMIASGTAA
ncbi:MAG: sugar ABC transporter ATP-binding protein [Acidobacteria bacterium]|nr:sugar ABC transporter ATP-binding protein [Acidobacteriota bacterium]